MKDNPANPGSSAMILERQVYTDDEKRVQTEWVRIKIFTEGFSADAFYPAFMRRPRPDEKQCPSGWAGPLSL